MVTSGIRQESFERRSDFADLDPWLQEIRMMSGIPEPHIARRVLAAVLHALRDQLPPAEADALASQLPPPAQQVYLEGQKRAQGATPNFRTAVTEECPTLDEQQVDRAIWAVFTMLSHHVSPATIRHVRQLLPEPVRAIWNTGA